MSRRIQGKASFAEIQDSDGKIQLYFNRDEICLDDDKTLYNDIYKKLLDIGDIIGVTGILFKTQVGEKTIQVEDFKILSKLTIFFCQVNFEFNLHQTYIYIVKIKLISSWLTYLSFIPKNKML